MNTILQKCIALIIFSKTFIEFHMLPISVVSVIIRAYERQYTLS